MLYRLLKIPARIALWMYCRQLRVNNKAIFDSRGPLLLACNHPNSFLDAIILSSLFKQPVYSLARGDVFAKGFFSRLLRSLKMLPVYRTSEGAQNMEHNYSTFAACKEIFKRNGIVLIFSEGRCINEWHLRPLKKGTARLAISAWEEGIAVTVLPVGINYQSFQGFGKNIHLLFGRPITKNDIDRESGFGKSVQSFNQLLLAELQPLVYEIEPQDLSKRKKIFAVDLSPAIKILLLAPAIFGYVLHAPLYYPAVFITRKTSKYNDHYDSILVAILFLAYPLYLLLICWCVYLGNFTNYWWLMLILLPFCGWSCMQLAPQFTSAKPHEEQKLIRPSSDKKHGVS